MAGIGGDPNAVLKDLTVIFERNVNKVRESLVDKICSRIESDSAYEKIAFPSAVAQPRKFVDQRVPTGVDVNAVYQLNNETHELTIDFDKDLLKDGKIYGLEDIVQEAAISMDIYPDYQLSALVEGAATSGNNAYDGNTFHGTTHKFAGVGTNNISNKLVGTGVTLANLRADFNAALAAMRKMKDNSGNLINQQLAEGRGQLLVQCPADLEGDFSQVLNSAFYPASSSGPADNVLKGKADLFSDGLLTDVNDWYLHYIAMPRKPFIYINRSPVEMKVLGFDSEFCANFRKVRIAAERRFKLGYGAFYRSIKTTN